MIDDRLIIPDDVKNMSSEEIDAEIERLEKKIKDRKQQNITLNKAV